MSQQSQPDYSAIPPADRRKAPWQHHRAPDHGAEDPWNRSPEARLHPELHSSAYGTVTTEDEKREEQEHLVEQMTTKESKKQKQKQKKQHHVEHPQQKYNREGSTSSSGVFGHTVETKRSPQAFVKRDLNNI
ncbi:hypothetical protein BDA99DRAFT_537443 [Phascolomyces articulosus]|uniref:Uncharacterized protein n=1 Tax=Phascolomyces articulosus TaxID=60185 RepID=A0AAD5PFT9_9FUNG|nr:hypothetical protein BDA99DRAFT_537443 [Phascolomyces articulosus]